MEKLLCKGCQNFLLKEDMYQRSECKNCRNKKMKEKEISLTGVSLAEYLLHKSCKGAVERGRSNKHKVYKDVKCDWEKPLEMKRSLMEKEEFWTKWVEQSLIYEKNGRILNFRPTIDRIESDVEKGGHYTINNLQMLPYSENSSKAIAKSCKVIFIKNLKVIGITDYESIQDAMRKIGIKGYNTLNIIKDSGKHHNIGDGYSVFIQTPNGIMRNQKFPIYNAIFNKQIILVDYQTGKEYIIKSEQGHFESYGIWFDDHN